MIRISRPEFMCAILCAAKNDVRYYFNGICIDREGFVVSTDGHRMFVGKAMTDDETVIVSVKYKAPAKFDHVLIDVQYNMATFCDSNSDTVQQSPLEIIDGCYPDWRRVARYEEDKLSEIGLDLQYLNDAAKAAKYFGERKAKIKMQSFDRAVHIHFPNDAYMIVMPGRVYPSEPISSGKLYCTRQRQLITFAALPLGSRGNISGPNGVENGLFIGIQPFVSPVEICTSRVRPSFLYNQRFSNSLLTAPVICP